MSAILRRIFCRCAPAVLGVLSLSLSGCDTQKTEGSATPGEGVPEGAEATPAAPARQIVTLKLAWPASGTAKVTETSLSGDSKSVVRYEVDATNDGQEMRFVFRDIKLEERTGVNFESKKKNDKLAAQQEQLIARTLKAPFKVKADGQWVGLDDVDGYLRAVTEDIAKKRDRKSVDRVMQNEGLRGSIVGSQQTLWDGWGGSWNGMQFEPGTVLKGKATMPTSAGQVEAPLEVQHKESVGDSDRVLYLTTMPDAIVRERMAELAKRSALVLVPDVAKKGAAAVEDWFANSKFTFVNEQELFFVRDTLRPSEARNRQILRVEPAGDVPEYVFQDTQWEFDWQAGSAPAEEAASE